MFLVAGGESLSSINSPEEFGLLQQVCFAIRMEIVKSLLVKENIG